MPVDWRTVRHFQPAEFGVARDTIEPALVAALDLFRDVVGTAVVVHPAAAGDVHVPGSQHPTRAVDCHVPGRTLLDAWLAASRVPAFQGLGFYPFWPHPGLHVDVRVAAVRALWWRDEVGVYRPVTDGALARFYRVGLPD